MASRLLRGILVQTVEVLVTLQNKVAFGAVYRDLGSEPPIHATCVDDTNGSDGGNVLNIEQKSTNEAWPLACFALLAQRLSCSFLASKHVLVLLVTKDESFAFESASLFELVDRFDDSMVNIKERRARGRWGISRRDHLIPSDDPSMVQ
jgi:hypothetical protein